VTDRLFIFDTTLRDGEQSPGASMTKDEKLRIARQLERLKVDVIEAGFAASSNGDFEAVRAIAASSARTNGRSSTPRCARWTIGYATSCPGPWYVTSPPRSVRTRSMPRRASSSADART